MINQNYINIKMKELNGELLSKQYKYLWREDNPTFGYCYIVSEALYHYFYDENFVPFCINYGNDIGTHWFLKNIETEEISDFTGNQFEFEVDHKLGKRRTFLKGGIKTTKGFISKRGNQMAIHLGLIKG
jgi:hypothetical protein